MNRKLMLPGQSRLRRGVAIAALALLLGLGAFLIYLLPYQDLPVWAAQLGERVAAFGWYGPLVFGLFTALFTALGVPRLLMTGVAAALFGVFWGLVSSQLGALAGAFATFFIARWSGEEVGLSRWPRLARFSGLFREQGLLPVLLIRQLPLSSFFINLLLGLTSVRNRDFLIGSLLGFMPEAIPVALIAAGLVKGDLGESLKYILIGLVVFVSLGLLLRWLFRSPAVKAGQRRISMEADQDSERVR
ncbi:MAG: TVP38/TMEM64 family protein [Gammaproteobacteria bacterium]|nr:TVP38/TMEM64 family protein [Gammaproteobacteria bacterium]